MAVYACAQISSVTIANLNTRVNIAYEVKDGNNATIPSNTLLVDVPFGTDAAAANCAFRAAIAADVLSQHSLTVPLGNIYLPALV